MAVVKYPAKNGVIYMSVNGTTAAVLVGGFREYTFDMAQQEIDTTSFDDTGQTSVQGFPGRRGTLGGFWASDETIARQAADSADGTHLYIYPSSNAPSKYAGGPAWVDYSLRGAVDGAVGKTVNFRAKGSWNIAL